MGTGTIKRIQSRSETERRYHNVDVNGLYELPARGSWRSLLQAGVHGRTANTRSATPTGPAATAQSPIDIYTGVAGASLVPDRSPLAWGAWSETTYLNTYVQRQTSLDDGRWVATVGLGYGRNRVTGQVRRGRVREPARRDHLRCRHRWLESGGRGAAEPDVPRGLPVQLIFRGEAFRCFEPRSSGRISPPGS